MQLIISPTAAPPALPTEDIEAASNFAKLDKAESTRAAYRSDLPPVALVHRRPETVAGFLPNQAQSGLAASTIGRRCSAIRSAHELANLSIAANQSRGRHRLEGIRRSVGTAPKGRKPLLSESMHKVSRAAALDPKGLRDRALLLLGLGGAFRRSEFVALGVADLEFTDDGMKATIRRSKTDKVRRLLLSAAGRAVRSRL
jgi:site-specific recombinase XerD